MAQATRHYNPSVSLPRHTRSGDWLRSYWFLVVRKVTVICEPLRAPIRGKLLARAMAKSPKVSPVPIVFLLIYRSRNLALVQNLLKQIGPGADVRLWALEEVAPELADLTVGSGPGGRFDNLNLLYEARPVAEGSWLAVADDDVAFVRGDVIELIQMMRKAGLNLAQPGQSLLGWWTVCASLSRPFSIVRDTNFVEVGPLFVADPQFAKEILPFPRNTGMGWGVEADWYRIKLNRYRIGVIDACRLLHLGAVAAYPIGPESDRMAERLAAVNVKSIWQLRSCNGRWWRWQQNPPWKNSADLAGQPPSATRQ